MAHNMRCDGDFFNEIIEDSPIGGSRLTGFTRGRNEALFSKVKTKMVMRIHGDKPKRARRIMTASAAGAADFDNDNE